MSTHQPRILFFVPESRALASGVLHAQVFVPARLLTANGFDCLFVGAEISDQRAVRARQWIFETYGLRAEIFGCYPSKPSFANLWRMSRRLARLAEDVVAAYRPTHMYYWTYIVSGAARRIARRAGAVGVYDVKGIRNEEIALENGKGMRYRVCRFIEMREIRRAERLGCVSERMKSWIQQQTGRGDAVVIPCGINASRFAYDAEARQQVRQELAVADETRLLCYTGGLGHWQRIEDVVRLMAGVAKLRPTWRFLFVTLEGDALRRIIEQTDLPSERCIIRGCSHAEVPRYLSAADIGIIMRHDNVVNNTASPIKIGEYLGCGLPIILTKGIGDFSDAITTAGLGLMLNEDGDAPRQLVDFVDRLGDIRQRAMSFCHEHLSFEANLEKYRELYGVRAT